MCFYEEQRVFSTFFHLSISLFLLFYYYSNRRLELLEDILWKLIILKSFLISLQQPIYFCQISNRKVPEEKNLIQLTEDLQKKNEALKILAVTDELAGLYNRHYFNRMINNIMYLYYFFNPILLSTFIILI